MRSSYAICTKVLIELQQSIDIKRLLDIFIRYGVTKMCVFSIHFVYAFYLSNFKNRSHNLLAASRVWKIYKSNKTIAVFVQGRIKRFLFAFINSLPTADKEDGDIFRVCVCVRFFHIFIAVIRMKMFRSIERVVCQLL